MFMGESAVLVRFLRDVIQIRAVIPVNLGFVVEF